MGPSTLSSWALLISRTLTARGIDAGDVFRRAKLPPELLGDPNARYPLAGMQRLWMVAMESTGDSCIGLEVGRSWHPTTFHALGYAALASGSLREALALVARYSRIVSTGALVAIDDYGADVHVRLKSRLPDYAIEPVPMAPQVQAGLAALVVLCRALVDSHFSPQQVLLAQSASPSSANRLRAFFKCPVALDGREDALVFSAASLDAPLGTANPLLLSINEQALMQYHARLDARHIGDRVRAQIARTLPSGKVSERAVAHALNLSLRSMQRKLKEEGASFRGLVDDTRRRLAQQYEADPTLSVGEVAYLLGFADSSSFSRASRRWGRRSADGPHLPAG
jgi:AraC-like DNA-binding protein